MNSYKKSYKSNKKAKLYDISNKKHLLFCNQEWKNDANII